MMRWIAILCVVMVTPAMAQDFTIDAHRIDRCIAIQERPLLCAGLEAYDCVLRNGGGPNMVLAACHEAEANVWDGFLNEAYADLQRLAQDREGWDVGYTPGSLQHALRDMQRAWIAYRDATCNNAAEIARPFGSKVGPAVTSCRMTQTARQYFELRGLRQEYLH